MQSRCCWPPDMPNAFVLSRSLTSSQSAPRRSALLDDLVHVALHAEHARAERDVVVDRLRERVRLLEHHPDPLAHLDRVDVGAVEVLAVVEDLPSTRAPGIRSFMRLRQRISVLLPQPDGPISAVMRSL